MGGYLCTHLQRLAAPCVTDWVRAMIGPSEMTPLIVIVLVIFLPMTIIWWLDVTVDDEFYDSFKREYQPPALESRSGAGTKTRLAECGTELSAEKNHLTYTQTV